MKILLANPKPREAFEVYGPSLGLCYLSSYLKQRGYKDIEGVDLNIDSQEQLTAAIQRADLVGVYCSTKAYQSALDIARQAKDAGKIVVVGGPHPSVLPEEVLGDPSVDYIVLSEGEESFHALLAALETGGDYSAIDGFGYKRDGVLKINPKTAYIKDLDVIPYPDRDLFRFDQSQKLTFCATRGCPYKCANCQPALSLQTCTFRMRSVDNVIAELREVARNKTVHFIDNDMTVNKKWMREFCEKLLAENLNIKWDCQGRVNTLTYELMELMKRAGCFTVSVGIESGSQALLDGFLRKQIKLSRAEEVVAEAIKAKLPLHGWFIIGIPSETKEDLEKTISFAMNHEFASVGFSIATPWPGTMFYKIASDNGWMLAKNWDEYNEKRYSKLKTAHWGPEDIAHYRRELIRQFRKRGWEANENDFIFSNHAWGKHPLIQPIVRILVRLREFFRTHS